MVLLGALVAWRAGRRIAVVAGIALVIQALLAAGSWTVAGRWAEGLWVVQSAFVAYVLAALFRIRTSRLFRYVVAWPALWFLCASFLSIPWVLVQATTAAWVPWLMASAGFWWSLTTRRETVTLDLRVPTPTALGRVPYMVARRRGLSRPGHDGLRIVQITDPHLGPFMTEARLRRICERAVGAEPDLILLTGDFYTWETRDTPGLLARALEPLRSHPHVYACRGNHDLECPELVAAELASSGVRLLIDEAVTAQTRVGPVQIVGIDHRWRDRARHLRRCLVELVRPPGVLRIVLLHDPTSFKDMPDNAADLVLAGHTHGGHVGLLAFGIDWTAVRAIARIPDHGGWGFAGNRLYVHRATGHYGFPLRIGVSAEESVLEVVR